jgi:hypothetical protein
MESEKSKQKSIVKGESYDSYEEFESVFRDYCEKTSQNFVKRSSHPLKIEYIKGESVKEKESILEKIRYKDIIYDCVHKGQVRKNAEYKGDRMDTHTKKIDCKATIRLNFVNKSQKLILTQIEGDHNQPVTPTLYQQYSNIRKPSDQAFQKSKIQWFQR